MSIYSLTVFSQYRKNTYASYVLMDQRATRYIASVASRRWIVWLWLRGASAMAISQQTGVSLSTVYRWVRRWHEEGSVEARPYRRRHIKGVCAVESVAQGTVYSPLTSHVSETKLQEPLPSINRGSADVVSPAAMRNTFRYQDAYHSYKMPCFCPRYSLHSQTS